jgi:hypothetical protein
VSDATTDFEALLRRALSPVEPPAGLADRLETNLTKMTEAAVDELEAWEGELEAFRDPGNWPTLARRLLVSGGVVAAGAGAGTALVILRARKKANRNVVKRALSR